MIFHLLKAAIFLNAVGAVNPVFVAKTKNYKQVDVSYPTMPANNNDFGRKQITLKLDEKPWRWYQDAEFFFHRKGTGAGAANNPEPNWFHYWNQIAALNKATGNRGALTVKPGAGKQNGGKWHSAGSPPGGPEITIFRKILLLNSFVLVLTSINMRRIFGT